MTKFVMSGNTSERKTVRGGKTIGPREPSLLIQYTTTSSIIPIILSKTG